MDVRGTNIVVAERRIRWAVVRHVLVRVLRERDFVFAVANMQERDELMRFRNDLDRLLVVVAASEEKVLACTVRPQGLEARRREILSRPRAALT